MLSVWVAAHALRFYSKQKTFVPVSCCKKLQGNGGKGANGHSFVFIRGTAMLLGQGHGLNPVSLENRSISYEWLSIFYVNCKGQTTPKAHIFVSSETATNFPQ